LKKPLDYNYDADAKIDLHIHSDASDGTLSPPAILNMAADLNLAAISITDHDTVKGALKALDYGIPAPLNFITGVEISANPPPHWQSAINFRGSLHILGYGIDVANPQLNTALDKLQEARRNRNPHIIKKLQAMGFDLSMGEVAAMVEGADTNNFGRPHIARLMVKKGICKSIDDTFELYLGNDKLAYVEKYRIECAEAIQVIRNAGGVPVLAHPVLYQTVNTAEIENLIITLKAMGLCGLEVYYSEQTPEQTAYYAGLARRYDLLMTGGSDFHGDLRPEIKMGAGKGELHTPFKLYAELAHFKSCEVKMEKPTVAVVDGAQLAELTKSLCYTFKDMSLIREALRHRSYVNEQNDPGLRDNERFEFLGDAVLNLVVGHLLMKRYPELKEGDLSRIRASLVNESQLAAIARSFNLGAYIQLGRGESMTLGREKNSILADTFEAVIAAVYLDGGPDAASLLIDTHFAKVMEANVAHEENPDYKSKLQEVIQGACKAMPRYAIVDESGPDHDKTFTARLTVCDLRAEGTGKSKKLAEQDAARNAFQILKNDKQASNG
jgi:ribonuclease III